MLGFVIPCSRYCDVISAQHFQRAVVSVAGPQHRHQHQQSSCQQQFEHHCLQHNCEFYRTFAKMTDIYKHCHGEEQWGSYYVDGSTDFYIDDDSMWLSRDWKSNIDLFSWVSFRTWCFLISYFYLHQTIWAAHKNESDILLWVFFCLIDK